jgi:hypothetical protein
MFVRAAVQKRECGLACRVKHRDHDARAACPERCRNIAG